MSRPACTSLNLSEGHLTTHVSSSQARISSCTAWPLTPANLASAVDVSTRQVIRSGHCGTALSRKYEKSGSSFITNNMNLASIVQKAREDEAVSGEDSAKGEPEVSNRYTDPDLIKARWWRKRYGLFTKFDKGIRVSDTMWFSVTPEHVANIVAQSVQKTFPSATTVVDVCGGAGGNTIAFSRAGLRTIYVDIEPSVTQDATHNATIYGCHNIEFYTSDFCEFDMTPLCKPSKTVVHVSPEWGGPAYKLHEFDIKTSVPPCPDIIERCQAQGFQNVVIYLPKNSNIDQLRALGCTRVDHIKINGRHLALTAYWIGKSKRSKKKLPSPST